MNETLEPDPDFIAHLEWQLRSAFRRRARFGETQAQVPGARRGVARRLVRSGALVLLPLLLGGMGMAAVDHYQGRDERAFAEARAALQLTLSRRRAALAADDLVQTEARFSNGLVEARALAAARSRMATQRFMVERRVLDQEEVRASGRAPQDGLAAPRVGGRDFVLLRLDVSLREASERLDEARDRVELTRARVERGVTVEQELRRHETDVAQAVLVQEQLVRQMELRARFLRGELSIRKTNLLGAMETARTEVERARLERSHDQQLLERTEALVQAGVTGVDELAAVRQRIEAGAGKLLLAELELEVLRAELDR